MHSRTVPITSVWFTVILYIYSVFLAQALQYIASNPDLVTSIVGSFSKDLEFPLALGDFAVDAFVVDACIKTKVEVFFNYGASDVTDR